MIRIYAAAAVAAVALTGAAFAQDAAPPPAEAPAAAAPAQAETAQAETAQAETAPFVTACPTLPAAPVLADGATARERDMAATEAALQTWNASYVGIVNECRRPEVLTIQAEMEAAVAAARAAQARYAAAIAAYQADAAGATSMGAAWNAEIEEFNNRGNRRN
jgi:hypothetical protein